MPNDPQNAVSPYADMIAMGIHDDEYPPFSQDELFELRTKMPDLIRDTNIPGWIGLQHPYVCNQTDVAYRSTDYFTPTGSPLSLFCTTLGALDCVAGHHATPLRCQAGYSLYPDVNIDIGFSMNALPLSQFIDADKEVRRRFETAEIKNYQWNNLTKGE